MPEKSYVRKNDLDGGLGSPNKGAPSFISGLTTALPGRTWVVRAGGDSITVSIDGGALSPAEDTGIDQAYADWTPTSQKRYQALVKVEASPVRSIIRQVNWYEDSAQTKLAQREVRNFSGQRWLSTVVTEYYADGAVASVRTETYTTLSDGRVVTEVT